MHYAQLYNKFNQCVGNTLYSVENTDSKKNTCQGKEG